ncbi:hypothetical protein [Dehalococcoides mccartyi]|uniref:Uncharacterized protein n=1 Tax=Dehalococcoides mccartyi (strain ATCC BAA-2266 / KCTC 15142 / 195) TaxID=243164 RepID=Q3Z9J6_DEHM1|nr:hypothetical protein [Dehalococcoides mccartyi]AAW40381.1 hypothetical protein DET0356 [Dehalococcoides mccartyi 195]
MEIKRAVLKVFNSVAYTASIQLAGDYKSMLEEVKVARNIPAAEMLAGRNLGVWFFDDHNTKDTLVIAVYS